MRNFNCRTWINIMLVFCLGLASSRSMAQLPTSAVYDVQSNPAGDSLRVYITPVGGATFDGLVSELKFTLRWPSSSPAAIGLRTQFCVGGYNLSYYQNTTQNPGNGWKYATFTAFGLDWIFNACPDEAWAPNQPKLLLRVAITGNTGCTPFNIGNDAYTTANGREPYVELDGQEIPFSIQATPGYIGSPGGACAPDCLGVPGGTAQQDACGVCYAAGPADPLWNTTCADCANVPNGSASIDQCNVCSGGTTGIVPNSTCSDCAGVPNGTATIDQCNVCSGGTTGITPNSTCADCAGVPNGSALPGTPCNDGNSNTVNDTWNAQCVCEGFVPQPNDCLGVPGGTAQPGTPCNDNNPATGDDTWNAQCQCVGLPIDCEGVAGGSATVGTPCNDNNASTGNDTWNAQCQCVGQPFDCEGVAGGPATPGSVCDDENPNTTGDVYDANCTCAGTLLPSDCNGVPGGPATPGTPCNDNDPLTSDDTWSANCVCIGTPVPVDCEGTPNGNATPGTPCDDGNVNTGDDTWNATCDCVGTPIGGCTENMTIELQTDNNGSQTTWEVLAQGSMAVMCNGGGYPNNATATGTCCVPEGCYILRVYDSAGDGMASGTNGGYILRTSPDNARIIDNRNNFLSGSVSAISGDQAFCLPLGTDKPIYTSCDKLDWVNNQFIVASANSAVSAEWIVGAPNSAQDANSGYQFWFYDPNGSYSFVRFRTHNQSDGFGNVGATRAAHMQINNWAVGNHIPTGVLMNVRVRGVVNGVPFAYGPACRFKIDPVAAACPMTKLMDIPGNQFLSCGQYRQWASNSYAHARPVSGATQYQFRFRQPAEGYEVVRTTTSYFVQLFWNSAAGAPLVTGSQYEVDVRAFKNGQWCPWGDICTLNIGTPVNGGGVQSAEIAPDAVVSMWPNPNRGDQVFISLNAVPEEVLTVNVDMFDMFGKRVMARTIATQGGFLNTVLELNGELAAGMYMVNITAGDKMTTERLVIQP